MQSEPLESPFRELYAESLEKLSLVRSSPSAPLAMGASSPSESGASSRHHEARRTISDAVSKLLDREVDHDAPLMSAGLDSVAVVELGRTLSDTLGFPLPATALFDYPSVNALAEYADSSLAGRGSASELLGEVAPRSVGGPGPLAILAAAGLSPAAPRDSGAADVAFADGPAAIPWTRWDSDAPAFADGDARFGALLADVAAFDEAMFGVSRIEAALMDPHQRLLLRFSADTLEGNHKSAATGVFIGIQQMCARGAFFVLHVVPDGSP